MWASQEPSDAPCCNRSGEQGLGYQNVPRDLQEGFGPKPHCLLLGVNVPTSSVLDMQWRINWLC